MKIEINHRYNKNKGPHKNFKLGPRILDEGEDDDSNVGIKL